MTIYFTINLRHVTPVTLKPSKPAKVKFTVKAVTFIAHNKRFKLAKQRKTEPNEAFAK